MRGCRITCLELLEFRILKIEAARKHFSRILRFGCGFRRGMRFRGKYDSDGNAAHGRGHWQIKILGRLARYSGYYKQRNDR